MKHFDVRTVLLALLLLVPASRRAMAQADFERGDRVLVLGDTLAERIAQSGYLAATLHACFPDLELIIRHAPGSADTFVFQPREMNVPTTDEIMSSFDPDVVIAMYGMAASFEPKNHRAEVEDFIQRVREQTASDGSARLILVSPIRHEFAGVFGPDRAAIAAHNREITRVRDAMRDAAASAGAGFVDLTDMVLRGPLTENGIHPTEAGCGRVVLEIATQLHWLPEDTGVPGDDAYEQARALRRMVCDAHFLYRLVYRPTNTEYVFGRRHEPFGIVNFPVETEQLQRMLTARDRHIHALPKPDPRAVLSPFARDDTTMWERTPSGTRLPEDAWTPPPVEAKGTETSLGAVEIGTPDAFLDSFTIAPGYAVSCFASEEQFPELASPLAMTFDEAGRLWVICAVTYPHLLPGERPACHIIVLEDTDQDGVADTCSTFADDLMIPTGIAVDLEGVYVGQAPDLFLLRDTDGDGRADLREIVASGFGMPDSHHTISAFEWDPAGGILMHEGVFTLSNVETPWGVLRTRDAAVWRFDPRTRRLTQMSHSGFANPWGHAFEDWGRSVLADASGGSNYDFAHVISAFDYPTKPVRPGPVLGRGRPTAGCEFLLSRHFPEDVQGTFLVNQSIGFHGTRWSRLTPTGSTWSGSAMPQDLLESSDTNFRPVSMELGPDGTLYIADWCNPIIGHMQYSVRDPRRDHDHGRIWRLRHIERPLVDAPDIVAMSTMELLEALRLPEINTRRHARRRLQSTPWRELEPELLRWLAGLNSSDPLHDRLVLESLWLHQAHGDARPGFVRRVLELEDPRARAGAIRVVRHWLDEGEVSTEEALALLDTGATDPDMRVRLETLVAAGFLPDVEGTGIVSLIADQEMDEAMRTVMEAALNHLTRDGGGLNAPLVRRFRLERAPLEELMALDLEPVVALVRLGRTDVPMTARQEALMFMDAADPLDRIGRLATEASRHDHIRALGELLVTLNAEPGQLQAVEWPGALDPWVLALQARIDPEATWDAVADDRLLAMLEVLEPGDAPAAAMDRLPGMISGSTGAGRTIDALVRHTPDASEAFAVLQPLAEPAGERSLARWNEDLAVAMAALRGMHHYPAAAWPEGRRDWRLQMLTADERRRADALYHDEAIGCARCHGASGEGAEGFPPLRASRRLLGHPERPAGIVVHGLFGAIVGADGRVVESAMAPLGSVLSDEEIALVVTYARQSWGNLAPRVTAADVRAARATVPPDGLWQVTQLDRRYPLKADLLIGPAPMEAYTAPMSDWLLRFILPIAVMFSPVIVIVIVVARRCRAAA